MIPFVFMHGTREFLKTSHSFFLTGTRTSFCFSSQLINLDVQLSDGASKQLLGAQGLLQNQPKHQKAEPGPRMVGCDSVQENR